MLDWKQHLIFGLFLVLLLVSAFYFLRIELSPLRLLAMSVVVLFASLFPDIDMKRSKIRDFVSLISATTITAAYVVFFMETWYYAPIYFVLLYLILKYIPTKHRGIAHTFKFSFAFSIIFAFVFSMLTILNAFNLMFWFISAFLGYSLHLSLDKF